jgi:hypothetical protein
VLLPGLSAQLRSGSQGEKGEEAQPEFKSSAMKT